MKEQDKKREKPIEITFEDFLSIAFDAMDYYETQVEDGMGMVRSIDRYVNIALRANTLGKKVKYFRDDNTGEIWYEVGKQRMMGFTNIPNHVDPKAAEQEYQDLTNDREDAFPAPEDDYEPDDPFEDNGQ